MTQLSLTSDARELIGLLSKVLDLPDGAARAYLALASVLDSPGDPPDKNTEERFTTLKEFRDHIAESHYALREKFGDREINVAELKQWYQETFSLYPADFASTNGNSAFRWWSQFNTVLRESSVILSIRRNWYRISAI
jgi:hypothetical protein